LIFPRQVLLSLPFFCGTLGWWSLNAKMVVAQVTKIINSWSVYDPDMCHRLTPTSLWWRVIIFSPPGTARRGCHYWGGLQQLQRPCGETRVWHVQRWPLPQLPGSPIRRSFPVHGHKFLAWRLLSISQETNWGSKLPGQSTVQASQSQPTMWSSQGVSYPKLPHVFRMGGIGLAKGSDLEVGVLAIDFIFVCLFASCSFTGLGDWT
jgi:hypothetical protein